MQSTYSQFLSALPLLTLLTALLSRVHADQAPLQPWRKKAFEIPQIGLGLWNSKDENVSEAS